MRKIVGLIAMLLFANMAWSQGKISGTIRDQNGAVVPYATVSIQGTKISVAADENANFSIPAKAGDILRISAIGIENTTVTVGSESIINVKVTRSSGTISDVVVTTALGQTTNKAKLGYSAATFGTAAINKNAPVGVLDNLGGKIAGAEISNTGGPGSSVKVVLRSYGVISGGSNQPLYVIDGVPLSNSTFENTNGNVDFGNGINAINPNDIQSITVLKGTAASSLYGGLAKNGAIMITTKRGTSGKLKVEYDGSLDLSQVGKLPTYQREFGQGWAGVFVLSENGSWGPKLDGQDRLWGSIVDNSQLIKPFSYLRNNLRDFYDVGKEVNNSVSLSGGNDITKFYFSYGNATSDGVIPTNSDYLERNTFALRTNSNFNKFSINSSFNYTNERLNAPNTGQGTSSGGGVFQSLLQIPIDIPISDFADYKNKFFDVDNYFTPYAENPYYGLNENGDRQNTDRFFGNIDLNYNFTSSLSAQLRIGGDFSNIRTKSWNQVNSVTPGSWNDGNNPEGFPRTTDVGSVFQGSDYFGTLNGDFILKYNKDINEDFNISALAGVNYYQTDYRGEQAQVIGLTVPGFFNLSNSKNPPTVVDAATHTKRVGAYAQVVVGYRNQLFLTGNVRDDLSSTLPVANYSIFYPGANLSWLASRTFDMRNSALSYLKFRVAYGRTGSDPSAYNVYSRLATANVNLGFGELIFPFNGVNGYGLSNTIANLNLQPIFTDEVEVGTEMQFFQNRIGLDVTGYDKKTKGQIFTVPIAPSTGYTGLVENLGTVRNRGIEVTLNATPVSGKNFTWNIAYTFSKNWNKVLELTGNQQNPLLSSAYDAELRAVVGKTVAEIYAPVPATTPDGKIIVDPSTGYPVLNETPLDSNGMIKGNYGSGLYDYMMGMSNTFTYKNWQLSFSLDYRKGGVMYSQTADMVMFDGNSIVTTYNDRKPFIIPNSVNAITNNNGKTVYVENTTFIGATGAGQSDDTWGYYYPAQNPTAYANRIFDRSFLKLRDVNISYNLSSRWASKIKAQNLTLGVYARNILLWTPVSNQFVDPEGTNLGNDLGSQLGEFASAPLSFYYGVLLKVNF
jgi:TonB-linked SusC/RagA family outer membrane protein